MKKISLFVVIVGLVLSCGFPPPKDSKKDYFMDFIQPNLDREYIFEPGLKPEDIFPGEEKNVYFLKGDKIFYNQLAWAEPVDCEELIVKTEPDGYVQLYRDIYITADKKSRFFYSFNNLDWFAFDSEENYHQIGAFRLGVGDEGLKIDTYWGFCHSEKAKRRKKSFEKNIVSTLGGELVFSSEDIASGVNLRDNIIYIRKGMRFRAGINLKSNLVKFENLRDGFSIEFLSDLYVYKNGLHVAVSFDGADWGHSLFSFDFSFKNYINVATNNEYFLFLLEGDLNYKGFATQE
ncbi:MAG: hypothetical protein JXR63_11920 [Spirochaetales bacterium]|nr:hypothetical protein [Spirochaetales bacterium]